MLIDSLFNLEQVTETLVNWAVPWMAGVAITAGIVIVAFGVFWRLLGHLLGADYGGGSYSSDATRYGSGSGTPACEADGFEASGKVDQHWDETDVDDWSYDDEASSERHLSL